MAVKLSNKDYIWSYVGVFFSVCSNVIMLPFVLHYLSSDMYGLWGVFQSVAAITTLFDFGFSTTFARNINYCWNGAAELRKDGVTYAENKEPNFYLMKRAMKACRYVFLLISAVAFLIMATVGTVYIRYISRDITNSEPMIAWLCYVIAIFLNLYYGYFNSFLRGVGAISAVNRATVIARCTQIVLTITLLFCGLGIIGTGVAYLSYGVVFRLQGKFNFMHFHNIGDELEKITTKIPKSEVKDMFLIVWHNASREGIVTLSNYLANQACTIICSLFMPLSMTGTYSLAVQLATAISNVSGALYTANQPVLQSAYITNNMSLTRRTMSLIVVSYTGIYLTGIVAVTTVGLPVLRIIKPETVLTVSVMLGVGLYQFMLKFRNCYTSYFSCTNRIPYVKTFIVSSVSCVLLAFITLKYLNWGIWGLILAQIVSQGVYNIWYWPLKAHREMNLGIREMIFMGFEEIKIILRFNRKGKKIK